MPNFTILPLFHFPFSKIANLISLCFSHITIPRRHHTTPALPSSLHDHTWVLLQHAQIRYFRTSFCHSRLRYTHCSYFGSNIRGTTRTKGSTSWLPQLWSFEDCVQRQTLVSFLWDTFILGWLSKHPLLELCKRSKIP